MSNNRRYDLSSKLTHFFRKLDTMDGSTPDTPEEWGDANIAEDTVFSPLFLLRCAIRHGHLWATWARRDSVRTVYGPFPATCFTDMPTAAFLETAVSRLKKGQKISTYALTFPKPQIFELGARPVIYGLSETAKGIPSGAGGGRRLMPETLLPIREQYRYVTYVPTGGRWKIDWTHEREWRWCMADQNAIARYEAEIEQSGLVENVTDIPGLKLYTGEFSGIGVIVNSRSEATKVFYDILTLVDRRRIAPDTFEYVLVAEDIPSPEALRDPDPEADAIVAATINLDEYLTYKDESVFPVIQSLVNQVVNEFPEIIPGEPGTCWLWLVDNVCRATRALVNDGRVTVAKRGKYLLPLPQFVSTRGLAQREQMTKRLADLVRERCGIDAVYYSVLNSSNADGVPWYNDDVLDNRLFYNYWSDGL